MTEETYVQRMSRSLFKLWQDALCKEKENYSGRRRTRAGEGEIWQEQENYGKTRRTMAREGELCPEEEECYVRKRRKLDLEG